MIIVLHADKSYILKRWRNKLIQPDTGAPGSPAADSHAVTDIELESRRDNADADIAVSRDTHLFRRWIAGLSGEKGSVNVAGGLSLNAHSTKVRREERTSGEEIHRLGGG